MSGPDWKVRLSVPSEAQRGTLIEIRTLIAHPMESGFRPDNMGLAIPRNILTEFICRYSNREIFRAELFPAIAANPYLSFLTTARDSGVIECQWADQHGQTLVASANISVHD